MYREVNNILQDLKGLTIERLNEILDSKTTKFSLDSTLSLKQAMKVYEWAEENPIVPNVEEPVTEVVEQKRVTDEVKTTSISLKVPVMSGKNALEWKQGIKRYVLNLFETSKSIEAFTERCEALLDSAKENFQRQYINELWTKYVRRLEKYSKLEMSTPSSSHRKKVIRDKTATFLSDEERRERNGDSRTSKGFSSTGVSMPTRESLIERYERHKENWNKLSEEDRKRRGGRMFISICMGGQNKRY